MASSASRARSSSRCGHSLNSHSFRAGRRAGLARAGRPRLPDRPGSTRAASLGRGQPRGIPQQLLLAHALDAAPCRRRSQQDHHSGSVAGIAPLTVSSERASPRSAAPTTHQVSRHRWGKKPPSRQFDHSEQIVFAIHDRQPGRREGPGPGFDERFASQCLRRCSPQHARSRGTDLPPRVRRRRPRRWSGRAGAQELAEDQPSAGDGGDHPRRSQRAQPFGATIEYVSVVVGDAALPRASARIREWRAGSRRSPASSAGLAASTAAVMSAGSRVQFRASPQGRGAAGQQLHHPTCPSRQAHPPPGRTPHFDRLVKIGSRTMQVVAADHRHGLRTQRTPPVRMLLLVQSSQPTFAPAVRPPGAGPRRSRWPDVQATAADPGWPRSRPSSRPLAFDQSMAWLFTVAAEAGSTTTSPRR